MAGAPALSRRFPLSISEIVALRQTHIPESCSMLYELAPMKVVSSRGQHIYDDMENEYLDCVNVTAHVGHCHPAVVHAAKQAMGQMSGILAGPSDIAENYIKKLKTTLPPIFDAFLFVHSGSEAVDLALQIARSHTKALDVVCVERSFHGCVGDSTAISPRQFEQRSQVQSPDWVHMVPCPDLYRGLYRESQFDAVKNYCSDGERIMSEAVAHGRKLACFISEPIMRMAGVIIPPAEWTLAMYQAIRSNGGLVIADEIQCGLGRCATSWWGFMQVSNLSEAVPDIIIIGKPMGNGHPMACVATTRVIADSFGRQVLKSYQCDPISASIGLAVLNTIRNENLRVNAETVSVFLREGIRSLAATHSIIGSVRGVGFMLGVEIVYSRESRRPAREFAEKICYLLKEQRILVTNEGKHKNIIILTPPMCFHYDNAHYFITTLNLVLKTMSSVEREQDDSFDPFSFTTSHSMTGDRVMSLGVLRDEEPLIRLDSNSSSGEDSEQPSSSNNNNESQMGFTGSIVKNELEELD